jgi:hypothetical protein
MSWISPVLQEEPLKKRLEYSRTPNIIGFLHDSSAIVAHTSLYVMQSWLRLAAGQAG